MKFIEPKALGILPVIRSGYSGTGIRKGKRFHRFKIPILMHPIVLSHSPYGYFGDIEFIDGIIRTDATSVTLFGTPVSVGHDWFRPDPDQTVLLTMFENGTQTFILPPDIEIKLPAPNTLSSRNTWVYRKIGYLGSLSDQAKHLLANGSHGADFVRVIDMYGQLLLEPPPINSDWGQSVSYQQLWLIAEGHLDKLKPTPIDAFINDGKHKTAYSGQFWKC